MHTRGNGQVGLVDRVDADVVDLVNADDVAVAADQRQHAQQRPRYQTPVNILRSTGEAVGCRDVGSRFAQVIVDVAKETISWFRFQSMHRAV